MQTVVILMAFIARLAMAVESDVAVRDFEKDAKNRPVSKVIALLKDMTKQLEKEGEEDQEVYETMGCWCVTNEKSKTKSIADAETAIEGLTANIESATALSAKLNTEITNLEAEIKKNTEALEEATAVREKELAEFTQEEKDSLVTINQLKAAVIALSKAHEAALLKKSSKVGTVDAKELKEANSKPTPSPAFAKEIEAEAIRVHMQRIIYRHPYEFVTSFMQVNHKSLEPAQRKNILAFLQRDSNSDGTLNFDNLPDDLPSFGSHGSSKPGTQFLQSTGGESSSNAAHGNIFARRIRDLALNIAADKEEHHDHVAQATTPVSRSFEALELPGPIQSLISEVLNPNKPYPQAVLKGVNTGLLESGMGDFETGNTKYEPASGAIFGVLKQMKENFEINLKQSQEGEAKASDEYDEMKAAKENEIKTATDLVNTKTDTLAETDEKKAQDTEIKEDTEASLAADQAFLADLKERCASMDEEFEIRTKNRQLEIEAVSKALAFLNSDEAHDLFTRTFNPSFLQVQMKARSRLLVANKLKTTALEAKDVRLLQLATKRLSQGIHSSKVIKGLEGVTSSIGEMIDKLEKEQKDEMKFKDWCVEEIDSNERDIAMKERDKKDLIAHREDLTLTIETLDKEIEVLKAEIAELEVQVKAATENREKEKGEFETTVADQRATQKLLGVSLKILADFYKHTFFVQTNQKGQKTAAGQAPPPGFKAFEKNAASGGVMGMMQGIIDDAKAMEAECIRAEEKAQKDYDDFVKDTNNSIETKTNDITTKSEDKAKAEEDKVQADTDLEATITELEALTNEEHAIHKKCDFIMKNFETSQAARANEMEGLRQATDVFSGASFSDVHR